MVSYGVYGQRWEICQIPVEEIWIDELKHVHDAIRPVPSQIQRMESRRLARHAGCQVHGGAGMVKLGTIS